MPAIMHFRRRATEGPKLNEIVRRSQMNAGGFRPSCECGVDSDGAELNKVVEVAPNSSGPHRADIIAAETNGASFHELIGSNRREACGGQASRVLRCDAKGAQAGEFGNVEMR
jgi:hypothetical protein